MLLICLELRVVALPWFAMSIITMNLHSFNHTCAHATLSNSRGALRKCALLVMF